MSNRNFGKLLIALKKPTKGIIEPFKYLHRPLDEFWYPCNHITYTVVLFILKKYTLNTFFATGVNILPNKKILHRGLTSIKGWYMKIYQPFSFRFSLLQKNLENLIWPCSDEHVIHSVYPEEYLPLGPSHLCSSFSI